MTDEEIKVAVNNILTEDFEVAPSLLKSGASLSEDLALDSLDGVDLVVAIEETFQCRIREEEAREMKTLQDIYDNIQRHLGADK